MFQEFEASVAFLRANPQWVTAIGDLETSGDHVFVWFTVRVGDQEVRKILFRNKEDDSVPLDKEPVPLFGETGEIIGVGVRNHSQFQSAFFATLADLSARTNGQTASSILV